MTERQFSKRLTASLVSTAMACGSLAAPVAALAQTNPRNPAGATASQAPVTLNFVNAEIEGVARAVGAILNRQFIVDPRVKGAMTLYSDQPITPREVYLNFLTALRGLGFTVVDNSGVLKIVPEADAKLQAGTVAVGPATTRQGDVVMTQIFKLNYENVNNLVPVLRPLISPNNTINANPGNNTLVITDYADNLQRLGKIIASMDIPATTDIEVIPLKYAIAADTAALVQRLSDVAPTTGGAQVPTAATGGSSSILVDPRSNALVVRAANPAKLQMIKAVVAKLDQPAIGGNAAGGIYVVYLKNADAVRLAAVLRAAYAPNGAGGAGGGTGSLTGGAGGASQISAQLNSGGAGGQGGMNSSGASTQSTAPVSATAGPSTGGMVQADPATNSLIITAAEPLYRQMRVVIDQLDSRRAQVYIESMIVKMDANKAAEFGFQWQGISGRSGDSNIYGAGTNFGGASSGTNILTLSAATVNGLSGAASVAANPPNGFNIGLLKNLGGFYTLGALAHFLESNTDSNVLSTPNLVALDNEEAKIVIGQNVPFLTGQYSNATTTSGTVNPFQTFERKDVGLTLRVRPQIGEGGTVRMTVYQENSNVIAAATSAAGLVTDKSSIETTVTVDDGQILVLGGLLKDEYSNGVDKVPGLGDVPVVGNLFRNDSRRRNKSNLMVFLRPVIMKSVDQTNSVTLDRYDSMRSQLQQAQPKPSVLVPINSSPVLPASTATGGVIPLPYPGYAAPTQAITLTPAPTQPGTQPPAAVTLPILPAVPANQN
ncbi:type II secretion system secretin GspD [soil metagenome]